MGTVWRVFAYLKRYPWMATGTLSCAILSTLMVVVFPAVTKRVIDDVLVHRRSERLTPIVLIALVAFFLQHGLIQPASDFEQHVRAKGDLRSAKRSLSHIQMLPLRWFDNRATGDLMTRIFEDVNSVERVLIDGVEQGVVALLQVLIVLGMMFYLSASLPLVGLAPAPLLAGGALWYTLTAHRRYRSQRRASSSAMNSLLLDNLAGIRQIKSSCANARSTTASIARATGYATPPWSYHAAPGRFITPSMDFVNSLGLILAIGFGGRAVLPARCEWVPRRLHHSNEIFVRTE